MILRDCLVRMGIVTSDRVCRLSPVVQLFFRNLLHICDGAGRFEARAAILRAVLYAPSLHKISERDVQGWLTQCHQAGLVKLYTVGGAGYGKVLNYGQRDTKRRVLYPAEDGEQLSLAPPEHEPGFFSSDQKGRKSPHSPPPGGEVSPSASSQAAEPPIRFRRVKRLPRLDTLKDELHYLDLSVDEILRPGGCAYNVQPTDPEKIAKLDRLKKRRGEVTALLERVREEMAK
ncbi:MAG TPA: hypothetical protein VG838_00580 [Opitutaceae bacterium]|nr:hypothetical protein [Opitutaceae bacterium]